MNCFPVWNRLKRKYSFDSTFVVATLFSVCKSKTDIVGVHDV